jgi:PAS domain-containing protein
MSLNEHGRWVPVVARLRTRLTAGSRSLPPHVAETVAQALGTCDSLVMDLAAAQAEVDDLKRTLARRAGEWAQLFAAIPIPCILTDPAGTVLQSNQAAAGLLNVSSRHLERRVITYFVDERGRFLAALNELPSGGDRFSGSFLVRPRERAPLKVDVIAVRCTTDGQSGWLWFFTRWEERPRARDRASRAQHLAPPADAAPTDMAAPCEEQTPE